MRNERTMQKSITIKLLVALTLLVGVYFLVQWSKNKGRSKSLRTELVTLDTARVDRITIESPEGKIQLEKNHQGWTVSDGTLTKKAMPTTIKAMLSTLSSIVPSRLAARSEDKWADYAVDGEGMRVTVYQEGKNTTDIVLGRFGVEGQRSFYTYVRLFDEADVYVADNFMKMSISSRSEDFRNHTLLRLNRDTLDAISFQYPDSSWVLSRRDGTWFKNDALADSAATATYLQGLNWVTSRQFAETNIPGTPALGVTLRFVNREEIRLSAYPSEEGWVVTSTENADEAWIDQAVFEKLFVPASQF